MNPKPIPPHHEGLKDGMEGMRNPPAIRIASLVLIILGTFGAVAAQQ
jgi:hypothetical protein